MLNRILVLDDNQDLLNIVEETLSYENYQVLVTSDSHNLIEIAKIFRPDLFILDYKVTGMKSEEICRQIKWHPQFGRVPVILSSAYFHKDINYESMGCDDVIAKPFGLDELVGKVSNLVSARA
ncbi:response regulator [Mucilaginibacter ginsenosidivorans]|uniref:Response regulator n=1 Tax=Mucilaginibacter ginsenosidivorans TaxID=398053 RepID=A0A5B8UXN9_9SPHI|nr:response regulator [Mucilaginibacter ginsenosidivorans]QEC63445.1 response regulator [Mucilaginibacter ginsenosidivorans]